MDKNTPTKVIDIVTYQSMGYSPRFIKCPNCKKEISKAWDKPKECIDCKQKLLWD